MGIYAPKGHKNFIALRKELKLEVILLQEIKILEGKLLAIKNILWREAYFVALHAEGKFEGILYLWDRSKLDGRVIISSPNFCSIIFSSLISLEAFISMNVYAPTTCVGRRVSWSYINQMREALMGLSWFVVGYFNIFLAPYEKKGGVEGFSNGMHDFPRFFNDNNMLDLDLNKIKFTWMNGRYGDAHIQEKLDRILICQDYSMRFGSTLR